MRLICLIVCLSLVTFVSARFYRDQTYDDAESTTEHRNVPDQQFDQEPQNNEYEQQQFDQAQNSQEEDDQYQNDNTESEQDSQDSQENEDQSSSDEAETDISSGSSNGQRQASTPGINFIVPVLRSLGNHNIYRVIQVDNNGRIEQSWLVGQNGVKRMASGASVTGADIKQVQFDGKYNSVRIYMCVGLTKCHFVS